MRKSKIVFSPTAYQDLNRLYSFLSKLNPKILRRASLRLKESFQILQNHPDAGYSLEHLPPFREYLVPFGQGNYVIRYRIEKNTVHVVHLWHSREDRDGLH